VLEGHGQVGFKVAHYDVTRPLNYRPRTGLLHLRWRQCRRCGQWHRRWPGRQRVRRRTDQL
jgi:hypothetical protein